MDNPIAVVKSNLSIPKIAGFVVLSLVVFALCDLAGITNYILFPVTTLKAKFAKTS